MVILDLKRLGTSLVCYTWSIFEMTVESGYPSAIVTLGDWPKNLAPVFQPMRRKAIQIQSHLVLAIFPAL